MTTSQPPSIDPEGLFDGLKWGCIVRGALLDTALTILVVSPLVLMLAGSALFAEDPEVANKAIDHALASPEGLLLSALLGLSATVAGAYYGARRAGQQYLRHGGWVAVVSLLVSLPFLLLPEAQSSIPNPAWYDLSTIAAVVPAGLLGGAIARAGTSAA